MAGSPGSTPISPTSCAGISTERRVLYGRRRGPRLRPGRRRLLDTRLPGLLIDPPETGQLDPATLFRGHVRSVWLEIGFGGGEHLAAQAAANPDVGFIGCEPYVNGVARFLAQVERDDLSNVRIFMDDARLLLQSLRESCLERVFVLFPDPWPKTRHHKRRIVSTRTVDRFAELLCAGGELRLATDHAGYARAMLGHILACPAFDWCADGPRDWRERPPDWPATRYEAKALKAGRLPVFLRSRRRRCHTRA